MLHQIQAIFIGHVLSLQYESKKLKPPFYERNENANSLKAHNIPIL